MNTANWINAISAVIQAVSVVVASIFAVRSLRVWRRELVGKRKFEIADEALAAFLAAKDDLIWIRSRIIIAGEDDDYTAIEGELPHSAENRKQCAIISRRIRNTQGSFRRLARIYLPCKIHLGPEATGPIDAIVQAHNSVAISNEILLSQIGALNDQSMRNLKADIWSQGPDDPITMKIANAEEKMHEVCAHFLQ